MASEHRLQENGKSPDPLCLGLFISNSIDTTSKFSLLNKMFKLIVNPQITFFLIKTINTKVRLNNI